MFEGSAPRVSRCPSVPVKTFDWREVRASSVIILMGFGCPVDEDNTKLESKKFHFENTETDAAVDVYACFIPDAT